MATLHLTDPVNGTRADATVIASNNAQIEAVVNGGLDDTNIAAGANIGISKLDGFPSDVTQVLRGDGSWGAAGAAAGSTLASASITAPVTVAATTESASVTCIGTGSKGTFTVTVASPAVFTLAAHGLAANDPVAFATTGALPTGLTAGTIYYVIASGLTTDNFEVSATSGGSAVNTTGTQSGTHSAFKATSYDGSDVTVEVFFPDVVGGSGSPAARCVLFRDATVIGRFYGPTGGGSQGVLSGKADDTPSAGPHVYRVATFETGGTVTMEAGAGGSGNYLAATLKVKKA